MQKDDRKKIEELITRYEENPTLADVYVEGPLARNLIEWFLKANGINDVVVYEIEDVEIINEGVNAIGTKEGNRGRVLALAQAIRDHFTTFSVCVTCVADKDFDSILGKKYDWPLLLTDYTSIRMYAWNEEALRKYFTIQLQGLPKAPDLILSELEPILRRLFLYRIVNADPAWHLTKVKFKRSCSMVDGVPSFDENGYLCKYVRDNQVLLISFQRDVRNWEPKMPEDPRDAIHGHDFIELLRWYVQQKGNRSVDHLDLARALFLCLDSTALSSEEMFMELVIRSKCLSD